MPYLQARLLNLVCLCQSTKTELINLGFNGLMDVINVCVRFDLFQDLELSHNPDESSEMSHAWLAWRCRETRRRTGMFVWVSIISDRIPVNVHQLTSPDTRLCAGVHERVAASIGSLIVQVANALPRRTLGCKLMAKVAVGKTQYQ